MGRLWELVKLDQAGKLWASCPQTERKLWLVMTGLEDNAAAALWGRLSVSYRHALTLRLTRMIWFLSLLAEAIERMEKT